MADAKFPNFTCVGKAGSVDLWPETQSEGWGADNAVGRTRATELLSIMRKTDNPALLGHVVEAIGKRGVHGGVEVGFFHELAVNMMQLPVREMIEVPLRRDFGGVRLGHLQICGG